MKTNNTIDGDLVKQFQSGNANALTELVRRWHKQFCEKAHWIVKDVDQSKDIAQDSWRTIIAKIEDLKEPDKFGGWALRIVYSKALDSVRVSSKRHLRLEEFARGQPRIEEEYHENQQLKNELLKAIRSLPVKQQLVIKLFYVEAYSLQEIGGFLNISIGTAKSRLFHAREKLKRILKEVKDN